MALYDDGRMTRLTIKIVRHRDRKKEHVYEAMKFAMEARPGRIAELRDGSAPRDRSAPVSHEEAPMIVRFWVRADGNGDARGERNDGDTVEELPVYESQEEDVEGELPPPYDEVVVMEP